MISGLRRNQLSTRIASRFDLGMVVVLLLPVFAVLPLLQPGLPRTADGYLHLLRVVEIDQNWQDGVYYPRWAPDMAFGYGYPIFNYFAPLLYHITEIVHVIGFGFESAFKLVLIGSLLLGACGTYVLTRDFLGARPAVLAAAAYVYAPYTLREIYIRGGYAQFLAVSLMPVSLWSINRLVARDEHRYLVLSTLLISAVIVSHNISGMLFFVPLSLFTAWTIGSLQRWHKIKHVALVFLLALTLSSFFVIPALAEKPLVKLSRSTTGYLDFHQHFLSLQDILSPSVVPDMSSLNPIWLHNIGTAHVILGAIGLLAIAVGPLKRRRRIQAAFFAVWLFVFVFMTLPASTPLWEHVPLLAFTQFPWRLLDLAVLPSSFLVGMSALLWRRARWRHALTVLVTVSFLFTIVSAFVHLYVQWPSISREQLSGKDVVLHDVRTGTLGTTSAGECLPIWVMEEPSDSPLVAQYLSSTSIFKLDDRSLPTHAHAELLAHTTNSDQYRISTSEPFAARFNTFYFPGWRALVDGQMVPIVPSHPHGLITIEVPAGEHTVTVRFGDTNVRTLANITSGVGLLLLIGVTLFLSIGQRKCAPTPLQEMENRRLSFSCASLLTLSLLALLLFKMGFIDPRTEWFRRSSPPGQVVGVQHPGEINLGDEVLFLGYDISSDDVMPGDTLSLTLYWEAQRRLQEDYRVFVHLDDLRPNYVSWSLSERINPADIPTSTWTPGFYVSDRHVMSISPETPAGLYVLRAGLYRRDSGDRLAILDESGSAVSDSVELGTVRVGRRTAVDMSEVTKVGPFVFGEQVRLLGYRLGEGSTVPGTYIRLLLYWDALTEMSENYSIFVHLLDDSGQMWAQADDLPRNGLYPTWAWLPGEIVEDEHLIPLEATVATGTYHLAVGIYELDTFRRLEIVNAEGTSLGDRILLPQHIDVVSP